MKIIVDFVRAEQHWDPDSGVQQNYLVFAFGGREHRIPCEENDVVEAVKAARRPARAEAPSDPHAAALGFTDEPVAPPPELTPEQEQLEREFGGDVQPLANPPVLFEAVDGPRPDPTQNAELIRRGMIGEGMESRPRSRDKIKQEKLDRMRAVAQTAPHNRVAKDDMGYPIVPGAGHVAVRSESAGAPTVVKRSMENKPDDDPFGQG